MLQKNLDFTTILSNQEDTDTSAPLQTPISSTSCSGSYSVNNGASNTSGEAIFSTQQDSAIHVDIPNAAHLVTNISGIEYPGINSSSHLETFGFTPQVQTPVNILSSTLTFPYNLLQYSPVYPVQSELLAPGTNIWIPILGMTWFQFVIFIEWVFQRLGYRVTRLKLSHYKGGDIRIEGYGEKIIIQIKHCKENTGTEALQEVNYARTIYSTKHDPLKARVISYSPFANVAIKDAPIAEIELWDLGRLITELRNHGIFYPIA